MKKYIRIILLMLIYASTVNAQVGTYFMAQIKKNGNNLEFYIRPNPAGNGGTNITSFKFDNFDFWVRQPLAETVPTFGAPVINNIDFPGLTITKDLFGVESNPYGSDPTYRLIEWVSPFGSSTNTNMTYNAGQEYLVFSVPISANFSSNLELAGDNENGAPYFLTITRNTAGIGGVSDYTSHGPNGSIAFQLFYTTGSPSLLTSGPTPGFPGGISYYQKLNDPTALPVTFSNYDVQCNDKGALLIWSTASEQNTSRFEIQRSVNGTDWKNVGTVAAAGNSNDIRNYQYLDISGGGVAQYRIRQVDQDGRYVYTTTKSTNCQVSQFDIVLYPVPASDKITVVINSDRAVKTDLQMIDMSGRIVSRTETQINKGNNNIVLNVSQLPAGQYMLSSSDPSVVINKKFTVIR